MSARLCMLVCFGLWSDVGESLRNVCMLDVFVILACACLICFSDFGPMPSGAQGMFICMFPNSGSMSGGLR